MNKLWTEKGWEHYLYWQETDRNGLSSGTGHPEPLKHRKAWSRHIDHCNRLVYNIVDGNLYIISCKGHYED